ncbi:type II toxin-antitoxin system RelE/ParE family toxin [Cellulophaga sp. Z1A5H]|uniref:type II toxin-antitoxin system RelE/ParE family toxin n=1 Tax=Cellulophaga sp. Z1A5H TaxID=2687291 RepID=UPI0013FD4373|nr:type II toxin-antitoxin system RelE/ParE family toxin [Cellulophaga sp. Z1A5H]
MLKEVIWSPSAENDFELILDYLQLNWNDRIINRFINKVDDNIRLILEDYKIFPVINEDLQIRKSVISKQNTLYYREKSGKLEIVRLFDSRQDPNKLKF